MRKHRKKLLIAALVIWVIALLYHGDEIPQGEKNCDRVGPAFSGKGWSCHND